MSCTAMLLTEAHEEPVLGRASSSQDVNARPDGLRRRRRHSSYHPHHWAADGENMSLVVDRFLAELNRRLDFIESYGQLNIDAGLERAWNTLHAVRDSCSRVREDVMDAGRRRGAVLVETVEARYNEALATRDTLEQKVYEGMKLMESYLADCEARAQIMRETSFSNVMQEFVDRQHKRIDSISQQAKDVVDSGINRAWQAAEKLELTVESALAKAKEHGLIKYQDLPIPWRINEHIHKGYRFNDTKMGCIKSLIKPSNETFNIWSHLIGLIIVLSIAFYFYPTSAHFTIATKTDVLVAGIFFFAACKCLFCSCMWHTFNSIAEQDLMERFACVDYTGISLLVAASIMTTEYTAFYCEPLSRWLWISITLSLGLAGVGLAWHPTFNRADMAWARVGFYVLLAATGGFPCLQLIHTRGLAWAGYFYAPIFKSLGVYLGGALLYAMKVPERWAPGMFDYVGGSHNIWHLAVLGGILFHYIAMQEFFAQAFLRAFNECSAW